jgi:hypothetical protein
MLGFKLGVLRCYSKPSFGIYLLWVYLDGADSTVLRIQYCY